MKPHKIPHSEFISIYSRVPRLCLEVIIKTKEGIVLSKRLIPPYIGYWHTPGGTLLYGEKIQDAIKRIAKEETGMDVKVVKFLGILEYPIFKSLNHTISLGFLVKPTSGELRGSDQGKDIQYFKKLPTKTVRPQVEFLRKYRLINN
ncbi:MAG: NUDIX domain-containing protein [Patescibacteria group bacterium]